MTLDTRDLATPDTIRIRFVPGHGAGDIGELWTRLERRFDSSAIMCSWAWTETWLRHYGDRVDHCFAIGEIGGEPVGIALVTSSRPLPLLGLRGTVHIGTAGEPRGHSVAVEYNRLLACPPLRTSFAVSLVDAVARHFRPLAFRLEGFVPDDLGSMCSGGVAFNITDLPCPTFDLDDARRRRADVLSSLRSGVRRRVQRSNRGFGELRAEWATSTDQAIDIYNELKELHQDRWDRVGRRGAFASPRFAGFHQEFISRSMGDAPRVMLFRLRQRERTIGCLYGFVEHGMLLFYQSGFIDVDDNRLKPGLSTHLACMQQCLERGLDSYNFLAGEARYKRELANTELTLRSATAYRYATPVVFLGALDRFGVVDRARAVKRWQERLSVSATRVYTRKTRRKRTP